MLDLLHALWLLDWRLVAVPATHIWVYLFLVIIILAPVHRLRRGLDAGPGGNSGDDGHEIDSLMSMVVLVICRDEAIDTSEMEAFDDILFGLTGQTHDEEELRATFSAHLSRAASKSLTDHARDYVRATGGDEMEISRALQMMVHAADSTSTRGLDGERLLEAACRAFDRPLADIGVMRLRLAKDAETGTDETFSWYEVRTPNSRGRDGSGNAGMKADGGPTETAGVGARVEPHVLSGSTDARSTSTRTRQASRIPRK